MGNSPCSAFQELVVAGMNLITLHPLSPSNVFSCNTDTFIPTQDVHPYVLEGKQISWPSQSVEECHTFAGNLAKIAEVPPGQERTRNYSCNTTQGVTVDQFMVTKACPSDPNADCTITETKPQTAALKPGM